MTSQLFCISDNTNRIIPITKIYQRNCPLQLSHTQSFPNVSVILRPFTTCDLSSSLKEKEIISCTMVNEKSWCCRLQVCMSTRGNPFSTPAVTFTMWYWTCLPCPVEGENGDIFQGAFTSACSFLHSMQKEESSCTDPSYFFVPDAISYSSIQTITIHNHRVHSYYFV